MASFEDRDAPVVAEEEEHITSNDNDDFISNELDGETDVQEPDSKRCKPNNGNNNSNTKTAKKQRLHAKQVKSRVQISSVVKLFVKKVHPSHTDPWKMSSETSSTGTGFIISGNRIVTNAHVVHRGQSILCRAQSMGPPKKFECTIQSIALPLDLAILKVEDPSFFDNKKNLDLVEEGFENLPHLDDNVTAVGFPTGGDQVSVTRGVVSRITTTANSLLRVQIDAAINPGNSGGPVFDEKGRVVGVASAHLKNASNIGYIIPATVVHLFLRFTLKTNNMCNAAAQSPTNPDGFCGVASLGLGQLQKLENPTLRKYLGMEHREGGVRVLSVDPLGACYDKTKKSLCMAPDDVLLTVNGVLIGEDGTVQLPGRPEERINYKAIVTSVLPTTPIEISFIRKGELITKKILPSPQRWICPRIDGYDVPDPPQYLICGGCVFTQLTKPWLKTKKMNMTQYGVPLPEEGRQIVMLSTVLASSVNVGYHQLSCFPLRSFDSTLVFSLQHLATLIQNSANSVLEFRLSMAMDSPTNIKSLPACNHSIESKKDEEEVPVQDDILIVLDREKCKKMDPQIRKSHLINAPCSTGIKFDW